MTTATYPVEVELIGTDGNAFALIGKVAKALRREVSREASDQFKTEAMRQGMVALKSADSPETYLRVGAKAHRLEAHPRLPEEVKEAVQDVIVQANKAVMKAASQELASGVTGSFTVPEGSTLDPNLDPRNLRVASGGDGWFYVLDVVTGNLVLTFGSVVQQQGQPLGSKRATKSREDADEAKYGVTRDSLGRHRPTRQERR